MRLLHATLALACSWPASASSQEVSRTRIGSFRCTEERHTAPVVVLRVCTLDARPPRGVNGTAYLRIWCESNEYRLMLKSRRLYVGVADGTVRVIEKADSVAGTTPLWWHVGLTRDHLYAPRDEAAFVERAIQAKGLLTLALVDTPDRGEVIELDVSRMQKVAEFLSCSRGTESSVPLFAVSTPDVRPSNITAVGADGAVLRKRPQHNISRAERI